LCKRGEKKKRKAAKKLPERNGEQSQETGFRKEPGEQPHLQNKLREFAAEETPVGKRKTHYNLLGKKSTSSYAERAQTERLAKRKSQN